MDGTSEVIDSYKEFLKVKYAPTYGNYCRRLNDNFEAGQTEAVMFSLLRNTVDQIKVHEDPNAGGVDFHQIILNLAGIEDLKVAFPPPKMLLS